MAHLPTIVNVRMVRNLQDPDKPWRVAWQSPQMCAPSFWYYETKAEADGVAGRLGRVRTPAERAGARAEAT